VKRLLTVLFALAVSGAGAETIVAHPQEKNTGITINGEKVGDVKYGDRWFFTSGALRIGSGDWTLSGKNTKGVVRVEVVADANITLKNLQLKALKGQCAFALKPGVTVNLYLQGENELESGANNAGVNVPYGSTLYINGSGQLIAIGGDYGAGIGASTAKKWNDMRVPTAEHEVIGGQKAFKDEYRCGDIVVNSGTVAAAGGKWGAGIGGAAPEDTRDDHGGTYGGYVMVMGGEVIAYGGESAAGIGGGRIACGGFLQVYGGSVRAVGGKYGAGIGGGYGGDDGQSSSGLVKIYGGKVVAKGGAGGAGIGGGLRGMLCCSTQNFFETDCKQLVEISGGEVEATGGTFNLFGIELGGAGIGGGAYGSLGPNARVEITGGTVKARSCVSAGNIGVGTYAYGPGNWPSAKLTIAGGSVNANLDDLNKNMRPRHADTDKYKRFLAKAVVGGLKRTGAPVELSEVIRYDSYNLHPNQPYEYGRNDLYPDESGCIYMWLPYMDGDPYYFTCGGHDYMATVDASNVAIASFTPEEAYKAELKANGTTFDGNGGEPAEQLMLPQGATYGAFPANPTLPAYAFAGWYTAPGGGVRKLESDTPTPGETLYAHWEMNITSRDALDYDAKPCYYEGEKWFGQTAKSHDGVDAMRSGVIGPGESTTMYMRDFYGPGKVSFWWNNCGGTNASLDFCIDGKIVARVGVSNLWKQFVADIPEGSHTISWVYAKGESGAAQDDCAYVDEFSFTPTPPSNDDFAKAEGLHGHAGAVEGTTRFSTNEYDEPKESDWNNATQSVWYVWSAPVGANSATFTAKGKDYVDAEHGFRPVIGVYRGEGRPDALTCVAFASDNGGTASVNFDGLSAGATYHIRVSGNFGNGGNYFGEFTLEWKTSESAASWRPANDKRATATVIDGASGSLKMSTTGASYEEDKPLDDEGLLFEKVDLLSGFEPSATNSVWFKWTAPFTGNAEFTTLGSAFNTVLGVYADGETVAENVNSTSVPGFTSRVYFPCVKGSVYEVCVAGMDGATGNLKLNWTSWESAEVEVYYDSGSGEKKKMMMPIGEKYKDAVAETPTETPEGYEFKGWSDVGDGGKKVSSDSEESIEVPISFYALFSPISYRVRFDANGGTGTMADMVAKFDVWTTLTANAFTRKGYMFTGWNTKPDGTGEVYVDQEEFYNLTSVKDGVVKFYAQWMKTGPNYEVLNENDISAPYAAPKAVTLAGVVYDGDNVVGIVELKLGKVNAKKGTSKVSGSLVGLDGKKYAIKAATASDINGTSPVSVSLNAKDLGALAVTIGGTQFAGSLGAYHVQSADVGGAWAGGSAVAAVEPGDLSVFAGTALAEFLPTNEVAAVSGGKWNFAKAASVKWAKPKKGAAQPEIYDETSGKGLVVDTSKGKTNLSGLKLSYTPKKGTFKGSFNVYALEGEGKATKLKKYKLNVSGVVVGGVGYGVATSKRPAISWPLTVE